MSEAADFAAIAVEMMRDPEAWCRMMLPGGRVRGREYRVGNLAGDKGESLCVWLDKGNWKDFATGETGGDLISLWAARYGVSQLDALYQISGQPRPVQPRVTIGASRRTEGPTPMSAVPDMRHGEYGQPTHVWEYISQHGEMLGYVCRYDPPGKRKQFVPWTPDGDRWIPRGFRGVKPLYNAYDAARRPDAPLLICEGEKAADAAREASPEHVAMTWPGGASAVLGADWQQIAGRSVLLWPDADEPGRKAMAKLAEHLSSLGCRVSTIDVDDCPSAWDAADAAFSPPQFREWVELRITSVADVASEYAPNVFVAPAAIDIPRRRFVSGLFAYPRGVVTTVVGAGGSAKSSLTLVEAVSIASGKQLLHAAVGAPGRVWIMNFEDSIEELQRRLVAIMQHYGITQADIGDRLFITSGVGATKPFLTAVQTRDGVLIAEPIFERMAAYITQHRIDVIGIDPFVSTYRISENDNSAMDDVAKRWARLAAATDSCVQLTHHTRKSSGREMTIEDARGGSSLIGAVRLGRVVVPMPGDVAEKQGITDGRWRYFSLLDGKANLTPRSDKALWHRLESVKLANGDSVGVVTPWHKADPFADVSASDLSRVLRDVTNNAWKYDKRGAGQWIGQLVGSICDIDVTSQPGIGQVMNIIDTWITNGMLAIESRVDRNRNTRKMVILGPKAHENLGGSPQ